MNNDKETMRKYGELIADSIKNIEDQRVIDMLKEYLRSALDRLNEGELIK